mgnify:CR=1 FL=1
MIQVADNMFTPNEINLFLSEVYHLAYNIKSGDTDDFPSGAAGVVQTDSLLYATIKRAIFKLWPELQEQELYDCHTNCFWPGEHTAFHKDNPADGSVTVIYYCDDNEWNEGGTEILNEDEKTVECILPVPGRIMRMSGNKLHRATSYRNKQRLTIAFKFRPFANE